MATSAIACFISWFIFASTPLQTAVNCYDDLDYPCAETYLAQALETDLPEAERLRALYYQALIATAWRDMTRVRQIVRNIFALQPKYEAIDAPPKLAEVLAAQRPKPAPPIVYTARADYRYTVVTDEDYDGGWWYDGHGLALGGGVLVRERFVFELSTFFSTHDARPERFSVDGLTIFGISLGTGVSYRWKRLGLGTGIVFGANRVERSVLKSYRRFRDAAELQPFWTAQVGGYVELAVEVMFGLSIGLRWEPATLVRVYEEQPTVSYLLPLMVGVRYGR